MKQMGRKVQRKGSTTQSWFEIIIYGDVLTGKVKKKILVKDGLELK